MVLQGSHAEEVNVLKEKQQLELQQAHEINVKQQAAITELEKGLAQLKLQQQELIAKHSQDKEALLTTAEEAKNAAVQVCAHTRTLTVKTRLLQQRLLSRAHPEGETLACCRRFRRSWMPRSSH